MVVLRLFLAVAWGCCIGPALTQEMCSEPQSMYIHQRVDAGDDYEQEFAEGTTLEYRCGPGYFPGSIETWKVTCERTFNGSLRWRIGENDCRPVSCGHPGEVRWGRLLDAVFAFPKSVRYQCHHGYRLVGDAKIYCQSNGRWSGRRPECHIVDCGPLHGIANGSVELSGTEFGSRAQFACSHCFRLVGNSMRTCDADGQWTGQSPECQEVQCNPPQIPLGGDANSIVSEAKTHLCDARIRYACPNGTHLEGSDINTCLDTGTWLFDPPICIPKCFVRPNYGSVVLRKEWTWKGWLQTRVQVGTEVTERDGNLFVKCEQGFRFRNPSFRYSHGEVKLQCKGGQWNPEEPWCTEEPCTNLYNLVKGGIPVMQEVQHGDKVEFTCDWNHVRKNKLHQTTAICLRGKVSGDLDLCEPKSCSNTDFPVVENGKTRPNQNYPHGTVLEYDCDNGFELQGRLQCQYGAWRGENPKCVPKSCSNTDLPFVENGKRRPNQNFPHGSVLEYDCRNGFEPQGRLQCQYGAWRGENPKCVPIIPAQTFKEVFPAGGKQTGGHPVIDHSNSQARRGCVLPERRARFFAYLGNDRIFSGMEVPDRAELRFHCEPVGELAFTGPKSAFCNNGRWNWANEEPFCVKLEYGDIIMKFLTQIYTGPGGVVYVEPGKEVHVVCNTSSRHRVFLSRLPDAKQDQKFWFQYLADQWNSVLGIFEVAADETIHLICRREDRTRFREIVIVGRYYHNCPMPPPETGLIIRIITRENFEFSCEAPYKLQGRKRVYCLPHGEWQHPLPSCELAPARPSSFSSSPVNQVRYRTSTDRPTAPMLPVPKAKQCTVPAVPNGGFIRSMHDTKKVGEGKKLSNSTVLVLLCRGSEPKYIACLDGVLSPSPACQKDSDLTAVERTPPRARAHSATEPITTVAERPHGEPVRQPQDLKVPLHRVEEPHHAPQRPAQNVVRGCSSPGNCENRVSLHRVEEPHHAPQWPVQNLVRGCSSPGNCENRGGSSPQDLSSNIPGTPRKVQTSLPEFGRPVETVATGTSKGSIHNLADVTAPRNPEGETPHYGPQISVQNGQSSQRCLSRDHCERAGDNVQVTSGPSVPAMEELNSLKKSPSTVEAETEKPVNRATQNTKDMYASSHREDVGIFKTTPLGVQDSGSPPSCPSPGSCLYAGRKTHIKINRTAPGMHGQGGFQESASRNISSNNTSSELENTRVNAQSTHAGPRPAKSPVDDGNFRGSSIPMNSGLHNARDIGRERHDATANNSANMSSLSSKTPDGSPQQTLPNPPDQDNDSKPTSPDVVQTYGIPPAIISSATPSNVNESSHGQVPLSQTDLGSDLEHKTHSSGCLLESFYELAPPGLIINSDPLRTPNEPALPMSNFSASCDGSELTFVGHGSLVTCLQNGSWAVPVHMKCIKGCDNFDTGPEGPIVEGRKASYQLADSLTFFCRNGTELHPRIERLICLGDEQGWSEDELPICIPAAPKK